jgi:hypothetical protein
MKREIQVAGTWRECEWTHNRKIRKEDADNMFKSIFKDFARRELKSEMKEVRHG